MRWRFAVLSVLSGLFSSYYSYSGRSHEQRHRGPVGLPYLIKVDRNSLPPYGIYLRQKLDRGFQTHLGDWFQF